MVGRKGRYLEVDRSLLVEDGLLRFNGKELSCPAENVPTLSEDGTLTVYAPIKQPNSFTKVANTHRYTVRLADTVLLVDTKHGPLTVTLPEATLNILGREVTIKDSAGSAAKQNITIETDNPRDQIEGAISLTISANYGLYRLLCDGEAWLIMSKVT